MFINNVALRSRYVLTVTYHNIYTLWHHPKHLYTHILIIPNSLQSNKAAPRARAKEAANTPPYCPYALLSNGCTLHSRIVWASQLFLTLLTILTECWIARREWPLSHTALGWWRYYSCTFNYPCPGLYEWMFIALTCVLY